jgi:O-glycosyl hydrolase
VSYSGPLRITAFKDPKDGTFAIVAVNPSHNSVRQTFSLNGFSTHSVTPWITSQTMSLVEGSPVLVNGSSFDYAISESSVITFSGNTLVLE